MNVRTSLIIVIACLSLNHRAVAQSCSVKLSIAEKNYGTKLYHAVPGPILDCMPRLQGKDLKKAQFLYVNSYLFLYHQNGKPQDIDQRTLRVLIKNVDESPEDFEHEYLPNPLYYHVKAEAKLDRQYKTCQPILNEADTLWANYLKPENDEAEIYQDSTILIRLDSLVVVLRNQCSLFRNDDLGHQKRYFELKSDLYLEDENKGLSSSNIDSLRFINQDISQSPGKQRQTKANLLQSHFSQIVQAD